MVGDRCNAPDQSVGCAMAGAADRVGTSESEPGDSDRTAAVSPEDAALVNACIAGAPGAWDAFVAQFAGLLAHVADRSARQRGLPLSVGDRDDIVAEVLLQLLRDDAAALRAFAGRSSLATYLTVIARRVAVRQLCRRSEAAPGAVDATHDPRPAVRDREEVEALLGHLDADEARLVRLHHLEARSYGEISRLTGLPLGSIGPALSRAREKMRAAAPEDQSPSR